MRDKPAILLCTIVWMSVRARYDDLRMMLLGLFYSSPGFVRSPCCRRNAELDRESYDAG